MTSKAKSENGNTSMVAEDESSLKNGKKPGPFKISKFKRFTFPSGSYDLEIKPTEDKLLDEVMKKRLMLQKLINDKAAKEKNDEILKIADYNITPLLEFYIKHHTAKQSSFAEERCNICIFEFCEDVDKLTFDDLVNDLKEDKVDDIIQLEKCDGHYFHLGCIQNYITSHSSDYIKCPICCYIYGVMTGDQPAGKMTVSVEKKYHCSGYDDCGTIIIGYSFPSGKLANGKRYYGTSRQAFLPDNDDGRDVLRLLKLSFDRKLTFTIGTSVTTGQSDCVIWNGIHHKTNTTGGATSFGYPDPTYFNRVRLELACKGVI